MRRSGTGPRWAGAVMLALAVLVLGAGVPRAAAQADDGETYVGPISGFSVTVADPWHIMQRESGGVTDTLGVQSGVGENSTVIWFDARPGFGGRPSSCINSFLFNLQNNPTVTELKVLERGTTDPLATESTLEVRFHNSEVDTADSDSYERITCRTLIPGYSVLSVYMDARESLAEQALADADDLLATLEIPDRSVPFTEYQAEEDDLTAYWTQVFAAEGWGDYLPPSYVYFDGEIDTPCGTTAPTEVGPHYCWTDLSVYLDQAIIADDDLRFGRAANVFFLAHETGHHIQRLRDIGFCTLERCLSDITGPQLELMADCLAGVWMQAAVGRGIVTESDVDLAISAIAESFGDPTHGSGAMRVWWVLQGYQLGVDRCFAGDEEPYAAP